VVAGHQGDVVRAAEGRQPVGGALELDRQGDVHQVAGDGDMVGPGGLEVGDDAGQRLGPVQAHAAAPPVEVAGQPLAQKLAGARRRHRQVRIGEMGEGERHDSTSSGPRASRSLMLMSERDARGPEDYARRS